MRARASLLPAVAWAVLLLPGPLLPGGQGAKDPVEPEAPDDPHDHGHEAETYDPTDYTPEQRARVERLFTLVVCDCPKEGWTKTLAGCPDGCADPQKQRIRRWVKEGKSDEEVLAAELRLHDGDRRVLATPDSALAHVGPYLILAAVGAVVLLVLAGSVRRTGPSPVPAASAAGGRTEKDRLRDTMEDTMEDAVERDLAELDE